MFLEDIVFMMIQNKETLLNTQYPVEILEKLHLRSCTTLPLELELFYM